MTKRELLKILEDVKDDTEIVIERVLSGKTFLASHIRVKKESTIIQDPDHTEEYFYYVEPHIKTLHETYGQLKYRSSVVLC